MNLGAVARAIDKVGVLVTLRRLIAPQRAVSVQVKAVVRAFQPQELVGDILQGDRQAIISDREIAARQWPGPPRKGDQLIVDGRTITVQGVETRNVGDVTAMHVMHMRGS